MDVPSLELNTESQTDTFPLLMERPDTVSSSDHVIDMPIADASPSISSHDRTSNHLDSLQREDRSSASVRTPISQPATSNGSNNRNFSFVRRGDAQCHRSPLNSGLWISVELVLTVSQIVESIVVLSVSTISIHIRLCLNGLWVMLLDVLPPSLFYIGIIIKVIMFQNQNQCNLIILQLLLMFLVDHFL